MELRWARECSKTVIPVCRSEDQTRIGELLKPFEKGGLVPSEFAWVGDEEVLQLIRSHIDFWDTSVRILVTRATGIAPCLPSQSGRTHVYRLIAFAAQLEGARFQVDFQCITGTQAAADAPAGSVLLLDTNISVVHETSTTATSLCLRPGTGNGMCADTSWASGTTGLWLLLDPTGLSPGCACGQIIMDMRLWADYSAWLKLHIYNAGMQLWV